MSVQYRDGTFSNTMPFDDAVDEFYRAIEEGTAQALYVGSENEIEHIKKKKALEAEIESLKDRLSALEASPTESETIAIPTREEIIKVLRNKNFGEKQ